ncbi:hypothetical protein Amet_1824 [Alkaliphilus metalliredigens QYMF]|uniref:DUF6273 domain-containing protein n=1 Tax=Alkaliphilus metalliredigens (strain QYMF) TaxID=293826 RepID=A6TP76_ALKMQ|nr:DUF6273 domain-containing protein [Alkaliphilus metalliredigens]ABR47994.1 hypothetical protein Amet_1824 [Alkaliphilus metalliredigens QYMF]
MKKNFIKGLVIVLFILLSLFLVGCEGTVGEISIEVGDYIQFGSYHDVPIIWRVVNIDKDDNLLLFSDKIISLKAFDAAGDYHRDEDRIKTGSNYWKDSNIRQWLNSDEEVGTISWRQNPPTEENMFMGYAPYESEKGFLADGNFSEAERNLINPVTHKSILHHLEIDKKDGGSENILPNSRIREIVENYDNSYYQVVEDKVFFYQ